MKKSTYLVTAINPDDNSIISVWVKALTIPLAYDIALPMLTKEYNVINYMADIVSVTLMNSNVKQD